MHLRSTSMRRFASATAAIFVLVSGCSPGGSFGKGDRPSEKTLVPLRVIVADKDQAAVPFPSLSVAGCPANEVRRLLRQAEQAYAADERRLQNAIEICRDRLSKAQSELDHELMALAKEYNSAVPRGENEILKSRNPLAGLSKARALKSAVDDQYKAALRSRIAPLEDVVKRGKQDVAAAQVDLDRLRASFNDRLFASLPGKPAKLWKTDKQGHATLPIVRNEPWYVWASGTRQVSTKLLAHGMQARSGAFNMEVRQGGFVTHTYRWLLLVPDQMDASGALSLDQSNLFDGTAVVQSLGDQSGPLPNLRN